MVGRKTGQVGISPCRVAGSHHTSAHRPRPESEFSDSPKHLLGVAGGCCFDQALMMWPPLSQDARSAPSLADRSLVVGCPWLRQKRRSFGMQCNHSLALLSWFVPDSVDEALMSLFQSSQGRLQFHTARPERLMMLNERLVAPFPMSPIHRAFAR